MSVSELRQSWPTLTSVDHALVRRVVDGAFAVCPNSWAELDHLATYLQVTPDERWVVVRNGIWPNEVPDDLPWEARTPEVLCLGALSPRKNSLTLVRAARRAGLRLRIVGQEPDKLDGYGRRVMAACGEHTTVEAPRSRGEVLLLLAATRAHAQIGFVETPGLATLEAIAAGASAVVAFGPVVSEYLPEGVWRVDPTSVTSVEAGLATAIGEAPPNDLSTTIRAKYDWSVVLQPLARVLGLTP